MRKYSSGSSYYNLLSSFGFAVKGIGYALKHERNLRIHFSMMIFVFYFSVRYYNLSGTQYAILLLVTGLVIICEMLNTAVEKAVDMITPAYSGLAKISKDVAAGAVLIAAATAVAVSVFLFWDPGVLLAIVEDVFRDKIIWALVLAVTVLWIVWPQRNAIIRHSKKLKKRN